MKYNFIYVDDPLDGNEIGVKNGLENGSQIEIKFIQTSDWESIIDNLTELMPSFNGIILDLKLNENPYDKVGNKAKYKGTTVALELRSRIKDRILIKDFPIILLTASPNINLLLDENEKNIFDAIIRRTDLQVDGENSYTDLISRLVDLAKGYEILNTDDLTLNQLLGEFNSDLIDIRFVEQITQLVKSSNKNSHKLAKFIINNVLEKPSFLIDESMLSAKLGVSKDSKDWDKLKSDILSPFIYKGVFSCYYKRWWWPLIENWWEEKIDKKINIRNISSTQRAELIASVYQITLLPIEKLDKSKSNAFWTVCKGTKKAIDTVDGFLISNQDDLYPWQEKEYVSINEALRPTNIDVWKSVATIEKPRLSNLEDFYTKLEKRERE